MKVKVIKKFIDAHDAKVIHAVGEELEITDERYAEICKVGQFVVPVADEPTDADVADADETADTKKTTAKKKGTDE